MRKKTTRIARPIAASAAATVRIEQREHLADEIAEEAREGDEVDVDREQDELDRHQDDDDVLAVDEDAEHAEREQHRGDRQVVAQTDDHGRPQHALPRRHLADFDGILLGRGRSGPRCPGA